MSQESLPQGLISDADHPAEAEAVRLVGQHLQSIAWPFERVRVTVRFVARKDPSHHQLDAKVFDGDKLAGDATLQFNALFLQQDPGVFLNDWVPHEVAHLVMTARSTISGESIPEHGDEWSDLVLRFNPAATPKASGPESAFDARAYQLQQGAIPAACGCTDRLHAISSRKQEAFRRGEVTCSDCKASLEPWGESPWPDDVQADHDYLRDETCNRNPA